MKKFIKLAVLIPFATVVLTACVATTYKVGNSTYNDRNQAVAASARENAEADAAISTGSTTLADRKLLVVIPTASAFSKLFEAHVMKQGKQYAQPGTSARAQDDFLADSQVANLKSIAESVKKAKIYREMEVLNVDSTTPNIQPSSGQDILVLFYFEAGGGQAARYFLSSKFGKQIVAVDMSKANIGERRQSLIDDLKAKALQ